MKIFKIIMTLFLGIILIILAFGFTLDPKWELSTRLQIEAEKSRVFPYINSLGEWPKWTAWNTTKYPGTTYQYEGPTTGVGAIQRWDDTSMQGVIEIIQSKPDTSVLYHLNMQEGEIEMQGRIHLEKRGDKTLVVWQLSGDAGENPLGKIMMFIYKPLLEKDLAEGLYNLKRQLEK